MFDINVHGVVVHASRETSGWPITRKQTVIDGSCVSLYPWLTSKLDSGVAQWGQ